MTKRGDEGLMEELVKLLWGGWRGGEERERREIYQPVPAQRQRFEPGTFRGGSATTSYRRVTARPVGGRRAAGTKLLGSQPERDGLLLNGGAKSRCKSQICAGLDFFFLFSCL